MAQKTKRQRTAWNQLTPKEAVFLKSYLDVDDKTTFCNATQSALKAYNCKKSSAMSLGPVLAYKLRPLIKRWFKRVGLSEDYLIGKVRSLTEAKKVVVLQSKDGTVTEHEVPDNAVQAKATEMGLKIRGAFSPEKHEHSIEGINLVIGEPNK